MNKEKLLLIILACVQFTHIMDFMVIMPLGDTLMRTFEISTGQFSLIVSSYTISAGISGLLAALVIDRFDRKTALLIAYSGFLAGTLFCALSETYYLLLTARIITGFFGGIQSGLILSILGDVIPYERRAGAMGIIMAAFSAAAVIGVPAGYISGITFGWNAPFVIIVLLGLPVLALIFFRIPALRGHLNKAASLTNSLAFLKSILFNPNQRIALLFSSFLILGQFTVIPFIAPYMERNIGFESHQITYIYLAGGLLTIFTSPLAGKMADRKGKKFTFYLFAWLAVITIIALTHLGNLNLLMALLITSVFFIVATGRIIPANTMITSVVEPENRGSFMSINTSVQQFSAGIAAAISGLVMTESELTNELMNFDKVGLIAAGAGIIAILIAGRIKETTVSHAVSKP